MARWPMPTGACPLAPAHWPVPDAPARWAIPNCPCPMARGASPIFFAMPHTHARARFLMAQPDARWHMPSGTCPIAPARLPLSHGPFPIAPARLPLPDGPCPVARAPGPMPAASCSAPCPMANGPCPLAPTNCQLTCHSLQVVEVLDLQEQCIDFFSASLDSMLMKMDKILEERDSFRALLLTQYQEGQNDLGDISRRQVVKSLIGDGWDMGRNEEDFNYARKKTLACIKGVCGTDLLKQQQLAEAMYLRYARCTSHLLIAMFLTC